MWFSINFNVILRQDGIFNKFQEYQVCRLIILNYLFKKLRLMCQIYVKNIYSNYAPSLVTHFSHLSENLSWKN